MSWTLLVKRETEVAKEIKSFKEIFWGASKAWENKLLTHSKLGSVAFLVMHHEQKTLLDNS